MPLKERVWIRNLALNISELQRLSKQLVVTVGTAEFKLRHFLGKEKATGSSSLIVLLLEWNKTLKTQK